MVALLDSMGGDHPAEPVLVLSNDASAAGLDKAERARRRGGERRPQTIQGRPGCL